MPSPPSLHSASIPEARLMLAILDDALATYRKEVGRPGLKHRRAAVEAEEWLFSDDVRWPFSFVNVCHTLGIEVGWIRARLRHAACGIRRPANANGVTGEFAALRRDASPLRPRIADRPGPALAPMVRG
jgi:hypothetical protein